MAYICVNGDFVKDTVPIFPPTHPLVKWGQGFFESLRMDKQVVPLMALHLKRVADSLNLLQWPALPPHDFLSLFQELCQRNQISEAARIRWTIHPDPRGNTAFFIEAVPLDANYLRWNENGVKAGYCPDVVRTGGKFSNLKSCSYQSNLIAFDFARKNGWYDALLPDAQGYLCEGTRTNVFIVKNGNIRTPPLQSGCVNGVARRYVLENSTHQIEERAIHFSELQEADEIFLTNALMGITRIKTFEDRTYKTDLSAEIYREVFATIFTAGR